jgi:NAD(P)-dependent dehydrogenase (short-subunit alcohol dehydrogenase family)
LGKLNILVNNAAYQMAQSKIEDLSLEQFRQTMETNIFGYFYMVKASLNHLKDTDTIINTGSIAGQIGRDILVDYATSKGAVHAFTKSLAANLSPRNIRVNAVVPGAVWTPSIPTSLPLKEIDQFDTESIMGRAAQPEEVAPAYVFLASSDSSFMTGTLLEVTGGKLSHP